MNLVRNILKLAVLLILLVSCSSREDTPVSNKENEVKLVLPVKEEFSGGNINITSFLKYLGNTNEVVEINKSNGDKSIYLYEGDLITKITKNSYYTEYVYVNGEISLKTTVFSNGNKEVEHFFHRKGNYIKSRISVINPNKQDEEYFKEYLLEKGNIVSTKTLRGTTANSVTTVLSYKYDDKHNPYKNVKGYNLLMEEFATPNNKIHEHKSVVRRLNGVDSPAEISVKTYDNTYNDKGYLVNSRETALFNNVQFVTIRSIEYNQ